MRRSYPYRRINHKPLRVILWRDCSADSGESAAAVDLRDQPVHVFGSNAVGNNRPRIVVLHVKVHSVFAAGPDEILNEIHATAWTHPAEVRIRVLRFDHDILSKENVTVEREVAK